MPNVRLEVETDGRKAIGAVSVKVVGADELEVARNAIILLFPPDVDGVTCHQGPGLFVG